MNLKLKNQISINPRIAVGADQVKIILVDDLK